jgi:hypothetical protein
MACFGALIPDLRWCPITTTLPKGRGGLFPGGCFAELPVGGGEVGEDLGENDLAFVVEVKRLVDPKLHGPALAAVRRHARHLPQEHAVHAAVGQLRLGVDARQEVQVADNLVVKLPPERVVHPLHLLPRKGGGRIYARAAPQRGVGKLSPKRLSVLRLKRPEHPFHGFGIAHEREGIGVGRGTRGEPGCDRRGKENLIHAPKLQLSRIFAAAAGAITGVFTSEAP